MKRETKASIARIREAERFEVITKWFAQHEIFELTEDRAVFKRKRPEPDNYGAWDGFYWFEVVLTRGNKMLVHGDIEPVLFAYHDSRTLLQATSWLGTEPLGSEYVKEKARTGMRIRMLENDRISVAHAALQCAYRLLKERDAATAPTVEETRNDRAMPPIMPPVHHFASEDGKRIDTPRDD